MRALLLPLFAVVSLVQPALGQQDERHALAERVVKARYEGELAGRFMDAFWPVALEVIRARAPNATATQILFYETETAAIATEVVRASLAPVIDLFERAYTVEELGVVAKFYESLPGKKVLAFENEIADAIEEVAEANPAFAPSAMLGPFLDMLAEDGY